MPPMTDWAKKLTPSDWINLGQFGTSIAGGIAGAGSSQRAAEQAEFERQRQERADEFTRQLQYYQLQQGARSGLGAFYNQTNQDRASGRQALLNASPLGAEQELVYQMARARGLSGVAENFQPAMPTSADIAGLIRPTTNILGAFTTPDFRQAISAEATARSIAERRKALAGVDPTFQFGSMGDYGIPNLEKEVATYAQGVAADRLSRENLLQDLLVQQAKAATDFPQTVAQAQGPQGVPPSQSATAQAPKKTSWWKKVVGTALPIAAAFIPGVGPVASMALQAAAGAAGGALTGGKKGALTGAIMGAVGAKTGGLGSTAGQRAAGETASSFARRAILQPSTIARSTGAVVGGKTGAALQAAAPFLGGIKPYATAPMAGFEGPDMQIIGDPKQIAIPDLAAVSPPPPLASRGLPITPIKGGYPLPAAVSQNLPFQSSGPVPAYDTALREIALGQSRGSVDGGVFGRIPETGSGGKTQLEATRRTLSGENLPIVGDLTGQDITNAVKQMNPEVLLNRMLLSPDQFQRYMQARQPNMVRPPAPAGNLSQRNNNPGNLRDVRTGAFRQFATPDEGFTALTSDLSNKFVGKTSTGLGPNSTLAELINVWAPPSDNNNTQAYITAVATRLGISPTAKLSELDVQKVAQAIATQEGYYAKPPSNVVAAVWGGR